MISKTKSKKPTNYKNQNLLYLRISPRVVLMTKILLDSNHINWMTDEILTLVLKVIQPKILIKFKQETYDQSNSNSNSKTKLDFYRGNGIQLGYYFKNNTPRHSILLKSKEFIMKSQNKSGPNDDLPENVISDEENEGEEEDQKPELKVNYQGFSIFGKTLIIVVEPFPSLSNYELNLYNPNYHQTHQSEAELSRRNPQPDPSTSTSTSTDPQIPLFRPESLMIDDDDDDLPDLFTQQSNSKQNPGPNESNSNSNLVESNDLSSSQTLLSNLIKNPNLDQNKKHSNLNLTLDGYLQK
ncbi:uncharacterized protein MELLADRAFT_76921 [Melampsora larici-populina 98AG31]|uniref:Uncharacterized protein n=1 Tax=Melampsora larici-populina (strain 98AG31 / pathotype 3-4-7) TaxID=747676 RepID=F4RBB4_MELLP|nr:uncharacterized protein MELLADRAFT_76921 [Melampsora larici-populina 98AG31]EGG10390.1 hypothetical protein MELLADRAFT_76921 [Melampsora larici-populina 98AG31]